MTSKPVIESCTALDVNRDENLEEWKEARKKLIGSSDIVTVMNLNRWKTPLELWCERTGKVETPDIDSKAAKYGRLVEPAILELFADEHPELEVFPTNETYVSKEHKFASATPDALLIRREDAEAGIAEAKHTAGNIAEWEDGAPTYAHIQLVWQLGLLCIPFGYVAAVVQGKANDLKDPSFEFDAVASDVFNQCLEEAQGFVNCIEADIPPEASAGDKKLIQNIVEHREETRLMSAEAQAAAEKYLEARAKRLSIEKDVQFQKDIEDQAQNALMLELFGADTGVLPDGRMVRFKKVERKSYTVGESVQYRMSIKDNE